MHRGWVWFIVAAARRSPRYGHLEEAEHTWGVVEGDISPVGPVSGNGMWYSWLCNLVSRIQQSLCFHYFVMRFLNLLRELLRFHGVQHVAQPRTDEPNTALERVLHIFHVSSSPSSTPRATSYYLDPAEFRRLVTEPHQNSTGCLFLRPNPTGARHNSSRLN